jgi:hypothetical protein
MYGVRIRMTHMRSLRRSSRMRGPDSKPIKAYTSARGPSMHAATRLYVSNGLGAQAYIRRCQVCMLSIQFASLGVILELP